MFQIDGIMHSGEAGMLRASATHVGWQRADKGRTVVHAVGEVRRAEWFEGRLKVLCEQGQPEDANEDVASQPTLLTFDGFIPSDFDRLWRYFQERCEVYLHLRLPAAVIAEADADTVLRGIEAAPDRVDEVEAGSVQLEARTARDDRTEWRLDLNMDQPQLVWKRLFQTPDMSLVGAIVRATPLGKKAKYIGTVSDVHEGCLTVAFREGLIGTVKLPKKHSIELQTELSLQELILWSARETTKKSRQDATLQRISAIFAEGPHPLPEDRQAQLLSLRKELQDSQCMDLFLEEADKVYDQAEYKGRRQFAETASAARLQAAEDAVLDKVREYGREGLRNNLNGAALYAFATGDVDGLRGAAAGCFATVVTRPTGAWANYRHSGFHYGSASGAISLPARRAVTREPLANLNIDAQTAATLAGDWGHGDTLLGLARRATQVTTREEQHKWVPVIETLQEIGVPDMWTSSTTMPYTLHRCSDDGSLLLHTISGSQVQVPSIYRGRVSDLANHLKGMLWLSTCRDDLEVQVLGECGRILNAEESLADVLGAPSGIPPDAPLRGGPF